VSPGADVTLVFDRPKRAAGIVFVLAHGAGGHLDDPLLVDVGAALKRAGHGVARFNFAYRDAGRNVPDRAPVLETTWRGVIARVGRAAPRATIVIGGKSMGGRMATHLAAQGDAMAGLLLLGYPLHPPKQPEKLRDAHLGSIRVPALFVQGTRDPLCELKLMKRALKKMGEHATLHIVDGGDHSLVVPKRSGRTRTEVIGEIAKATETWLTASGIR
jgi:uncharacterized protein